MENWPVFIERIGCLAYNSHFITLPVLFPTNNFFIMISYVQVWSHLFPCCAHVRDAHGITSESSEHTFTTYDEFLKWKSSEEESCFSNYVKHRWSVLKDSIRYSYFYCNRSRDLKSKGTGARNTKIQKSSKIGATCIAHMKVEESIANGSCKVSYCYTHCGHKKDLAHIRMPKV